MKIRKVLLMSAYAVALTGLTTTADAASTYVSIFGGASFLQNPGLKGLSHTHSTTYTFVSHQSVDTGFKTGYVVGANAGIDWGTFRSEIEFAYHSNNSGKHATLRTLYQYAPIGGALTTVSQSTREVPSDIQLSAYSLMANAWYDFHGFDFAGITPYIGGGIGLAQVQINGKLDGINLIEKNDYTFAWQLGAGASLPISDSVKLFVDYRYFAADGANLKLRPGFHGGDVDADYDAHEVLVGIRYNP
jgi:OOP family OmpA-OmpF porin